MVTLISFSCTCHTLCTLIKVVKQTVMTVVYGVTWVGGRKQIEVGHIALCKKNSGDTWVLFDYMQRQLEGNIPDDQLWDSSSYLVESVFQTLRKMFTNAREIQVCALSCLGCSFYKTHNYYTHNNKLDGQHFCCMKPYNIYANIRDTGRGQDIDTGQAEYWHGSKFV